MADFINKSKELSRYFPKPFYDLKPGQGISIWLDIAGEELDDAAFQVLQARLQFLLATATGKYLDVHGTNRDVFRPRGFNMPDTVYRELIKIVSNSPKNIERIFERILALYFGPNAINEGIADVYSYRPNEIVVQLKAQALIIASSRDLYGTAYLHETHLGYDGDSIDLWTGSLPVALSSGDTGFTFGSLPVGMPDHGSIHLVSSLSPAEVLRYERIGLQVFFRSAVGDNYPINTAISGPKLPEDYPNGFVYDSEKRSDLVGSYTTGATVINIGVFPEKLPLRGTIYIGNPTSSNFEAKGFTRSSLTSTVLNLMGGLNFPHASGDSILLPNMPRKIKTTLTAPILAGSSMAKITVANGADFPLERGAIRFAQSFGNEEIVPFESRKISDNTKLIIDPGYVFQYDHANLEKVQFMARKTSPSIDGTDWAFYLNDTDSLRAQFFNLLRRLKATGMKMVFEVID